MRNFAVSATYYFPVSCKERKQPCVGDKPEAKGRADLLPLLLYASLSVSLSRSSRPFTDHPWLAGQRARR